MDGSSPGGGDGDTAAHGDISMQYTWIVAGASCAGGG